jgi:hypothetical protein
MTARLRPVRPGQAQPRGHLAAERRVGRQQCGKPAEPIRRDAGSRFGLHQRRQPQNTLGGHLRKHGTEQALPLHLGHHRAGIVGGQQLQEFIADPLARERHQIVRPRRTGRQPGRLKPVGKSRGETEEAQDPQMILGDAHERVADEAHGARGDVGEPAEPVPDLAACRVCVESVDGEIAPGRVALPVVGERHLGPPAVGCEIGAQCRDLVRRLGDHRRHRSVPEAGRDRLDPSVPEPLQHCLGPQPRCEIDVGHGKTEERVAHRAPDHPGLATVGAEHIGKAPEAWPGIKDAWRKPGLGLSQAAPPG